ncbi:MAG TPA: DUF3109 domain-containing protein [Bacteroidetes bacterium]|nr:DUF3109 domain-containing protein [Bacteroidota bacterium]
MTPVFVHGMSFVSSRFFGILKHMRTPESRSVGTVQVDRNVLSLSFACDLKACRGACCTIPGGRGAPLLDEEIEHIRSAVAVVAPLLSERHQNILKYEGPLEGAPGDYHTRCVDNGPCVFVVERDGIAACSIELAHREGRLEWRKPLSCHLFPLRIDRGVVHRVRYEYLSQCEPALAKGTQERIPMTSFLREAMVRAYGEPWVQALESTDHPAGPE